MNRPSLAKSFCAFIIAPFLFSACKERSSDGKMASQSLATLSSSGEEQSEEAEFKAGKFIFDSPDALSLAAQEESIIPTLYQHYKVSRNNGSFSLSYNTKTFAKWNQFSQVYLVQYTNITNTTGPDPSILNRELALRYTPLSLRENGRLSSSAELSIQIQNSCFTFITSQNTLYISQHGIFTFGEAIPINPNEQAEAAGEICLNENAQISYLNNKSMTTLIHDEITRTRLTQLLKSDLGNSISNNESLERLVQTHLRLFEKIPQRANLILDLDRTDKAILFQKLQILANLRRVHDSTGISIEIDGKEQNVLLKKIDPLHFIMKHMRSSQTLSFLKVENVNNESIQPLVFLPNGILHYFKVANDLFINENSLYRERNLQSILEKAEQSKRLQAYENMKSLQFKINGYQSVNIGKLMEALLP